MGQRTISIPTITLAILASRMMGYPVMSENDLLRIIHDTPTTELVVDNVEEKRELREIWKGTSIEKFNRYTSLSDAIYDGDLLNWMKNESDKQDVYETSKSQLIDIDSSDKTELLYGTIIKYFGLYDSGSDNDSGLKSTITYREFINMLSKSYKGSEVLIEHIMHDNYIKDLERKFDKKINYLEMLHLTVRIYLGLLCDEINIYEKSEAYRELVDDYGYNAEQVKSLFIGYETGIVESINVGILDKRVTCMKALDTILCTLRFKVCTAV